MPLYEPVAYYHHHKNYLKGKTEYIDEEDEDDSDVEIYHDDEKRGFVSSNSHYYENALSSRHQRSARLLESSREDELQMSRTPSREENLDIDDVTAAAEILDGCRPRKPSPLTIIQVKNPQSNLDNDVDWLGAFAVRKICIFAIFGIGICLSFVAALSWTLTYCEDGFDENGNSCRNAASFLLLQGKSTPKESVWTKVFDDIVLTGGVQIVSRKITKNTNSNHHPTINTQQFDVEDLLVSGYVHVTSRISHPYSSHIQKQGKQQQQQHQQHLLSGLIGVKVSDGSESWRRPFINVQDEVEPSKHNCRLLDTNNDGTLDCIVVGNHGLLSAIDPNNGEELWRMHHHIPLVNISLPRVLPDLDGDLIPDLVAACAVTLPSGVRDDHVHIRNNFILISGKTGKVQGRPYLVEQCTDLNVLNVTSNLELQFDCQGLSGPDEFEMTINEFYLKVYNQELPVAMQSTHKNMHDHAPFREYQQSGVVGEDKAEAIRDSIHLDWNSIRPNCPECGVNVKIWENFAHRLLWNRTWFNSVAFQPLSMRYETDRWDSPIEGFVFRLWTWDDPKDTFTLRKSKFNNNVNPVDRDDDSKYNHREFVKRKANEAIETNEDEEDEDSNSFNSVYKSHNGNDDYQQNQEDDNLQDQQISPYSLISNLLPFGHPNLGPSHRRLLAVGYDYEPHSSSNSNNHIIYGKRKKHHRKSTKKKKKMHSNHHRAYGYNNNDYDYRVHNGTKAALNKKSSYISYNAQQSFLRNEDERIKTIHGIYRDQIRYLNVTETIFYATLNHTNTKIVSLFNHTIVQRCTYLDNLETYQCFPHYSPQSNSMVILGDDNHGIDADTRYLLFTTQSLVKKIKRRGEPFDKTSDKSSPSINPSQKTTKHKSDIEHEQTVFSDHEWVMETQLHKRKLNKYIDYTKHL